MNKQGKERRNSALYGALSVCLLVMLSWSAVSAQGPILQVTKTPDPTSIWQRGCEPTPVKSTVTLRLFGGGDCVTVGMPVDAMLVFDRSGSMYGAPIESTKVAAKYFVDLLRNGDRDRAGLVSFGQNVTLNMALGQMDASGKALLKSAINYLAAGGFTPLGDAVKMANSQFTSGRPDVDWVEIVLSDGDPKTFIGSDPIAAAQQAADRGIVMYVIGLSVSSPVHKAMLQQMATLTGGVYYDVNILSALRGIFEDIAYDIICTAGKDITVIETIQSYFHVIGGCASGFSIPPLTCVTNYDGTMTATWFIDQIDVGESWTVTFEIESDSINTNLPVDVASRSYVNYTNYLGPDREYIPQAYVTVKSCTPEIESCKRDILDGEKYVNGYFSPGDTILYNVTVNNTGYDATGVIYCDTLDTYTTLIAASITAPGGAVTVAPGGGSFCVDYGTLPEDGVRNISFRAVIDDPVPEFLTQVKNQGFVASHELPDEPTNDPDTVPDDDPTITPIRSEAIIEATKRDVVIGGGDLNPGDVIEYTAVLSNTGNKTVSGLTYFDAIPVHTTYVPGSASTGCGGTITGTNPLTVTGITLAPDGGCPITFRVQVNECVPAGVSEISNQGYVQNIPNTANEPTNDPDTVPDDDPTRTPLVASPQIEVKKVDAIVGGKPCVEPGGYVNYTVTITNNGDEGATGLSFVDTLPQYTTLVAGTFQSSGCGGSAAVVGRVLQMSNLSLSCDAQCQVTFQVKVDTPLPDGVETLSNQAFVSIPGDGRVPSDDPGTAEPNDPTRTCILAGPHIVVTKVDAVVGGLSYVVPGGTINYTIRICNEGNQNANGMSFADGIPQYTTYKAASATSTCGTVTVDGDTLRIASFNLAANNTCCTVTFSVVVNTSVPPGVEWITNQAFVRNIPNGQSTVPSDDPDTPTEPDDPTDTPLRTGVNVTVSKTDRITGGASGGSVLPGGTIEYTFTISNSGPEAANDLTFTDPTPEHTTYKRMVSNTCGVLGTTSPLTVTGIDIAAGGSCQIKYEVLVDSQVPDEATQILNWGEVCNIPNRPCERDSADTPLLTGVNIVVSKTYRDVNGSPLYAGDILEYTFTITNNGPEAAIDLTFYDPTPAYTTFQSLTSNTCGTLQTTSPLSITGIDLAVGASCQVRYRLTVDAGAPAGTRIVNWGEACEIAGSPCERDTITTTVQQPPTSQVWDPMKRAKDLNGGELRPGDIIEYTITMLVDEDIQDLIFDDPLPANTHNLRIVSWPSGAVNASTSSAVKITNIDLVGGQAVQVVFRVTVKIDVPTSVTVISNQGVLRDIPDENRKKTDDPDTIEPDDPTDLPLVHDTPVWDPYVEALLVAHDENGGELVSGDVIRYLTRIVNTGPEPVYNLIFTCPIPEYTENLAMVSIPAGASDISLPDAVTVSGMALEVGEMCQVEFTVQVSAALPMSAASIACQGWVGNIPFMEDEPSDDPETIADDDATVLALSETRKCDVDGNGTVSLADLFMQLRQVIEEVELTEAQFWAADLDDDGAVNIMDMMGCIRLSMSTPKMAGGVISLPQVTVSQGGLVSVPVYVGSGLQVRGAWLEVSCDQSMLVPVAARPTAWTSGLSLVQKQSDGALWVLLYAPDESELQSGEAGGHLLDIVFQVTGTAAEMSEVRIKEGIVFASPMEVVVSEPLSGSVLVKGFVPDGYALSQNYPNPFNPTTSIQYAVGSGQSTSHVILKVFNVMGQEAATLVDAVQEPGFYSVTWDASQVPSGVYFYTIRTEGFTATKRMVLTK